MEAAVIPLPNHDITQPVTTITFIMEYKKKIKKSTLILGSNVQIEVIIYLFLYTEFTYIIIGLIIFCLMFTRTVWIKTTNKDIFSLILFTL